MTFRFEDTPADHLAAGQMFRNESGDAWKLWVVAGGGLVTVFGAAAWWLEFPELFLAGLAVGSALVGSTTFSWWSLRRAAARLPMERREVEIGPEVIVFRGPADEVTVPVAKLRRVAIDSRGLLLDFWPEFWSFVPARSFADAGGEEVVRTELAVRLGAAWKKQLPLVAPFGRHGP